MPLVISHALLRTQLIGTNGLFLAAGTGFQTTSHRLLIYKGTMPTEVPASISSQSANLLVDLTSAIASVQENSSNLTTTRVAQVTTNVIASASGLATWFLYTRQGQDDMTAYAACIGTVGTSGSGAALEIPDVNIVSGNGYKCNGLRLNYLHAFA